MKKFNKLKKDEIFNLSEDERALAKALCNMLAARLFNIERGSELNQCSKESIWDYEEYKDKLSLEQYQMYKKIIEAEHALFSVY